MNLSSVALTSLLTSSSAAVWESDRFRNNGLGHINHHLDDGASSLLEGNVSEDKAPFLVAVGRAFGDDESSAGGNGGGGGGGLGGVTAHTQDHLGGGYGHRGSAMVDVAVEGGGISGDANSGEGRWGDVLEVANDVGSGVIAKKTAAKEGGTNWWKGDSSSDVQDVSSLAGRDEEVVDERDSSEGNSGVYAVVSGHDSVQVTAVSRRDEVVLLEELGNGNISGFNDGDELNLQDSVLVDQVDPSINDKSSKSYWTNFAVLIFVMIMTALSCLAYPRFMFMLIPNLPSPKWNKQGKSCRADRGPNWYLVLGLSCFLMTTVNGTLRGGFKDPSEQVFPLYEGLSSAPRYLQGESSEPFTLASLDPGVFLDALGTAKEAVTEYVAEELNEVFEPLKDQLPSLISKISPDSIKAIQSKFTDCFEKLDGGNLDRLESITSVISGFSPDAALDTLMDPDEGGSCSPPDLGLPDLSSVKDEAQAFSLHLYECIAETIKSVDLGPLSIEVPDLTVNRRELEDEEDDKKYFGFTVGLGTSVDINGLRKGPAEFLSTTLAGVGLEFGYDDGERGDPAAGFGLGFTPPFGAVSLLSFTVDENTCPAGYYDCRFEYGIVVEKKKCPAGKWCEGGQTTNTYPRLLPDSLPDCKGGYYCPKGSTSPRGKPIEKFKFTDENGPYTACGAGRVCRCEAGYYCPKGSTTPRGNPLIRFSDFGLVQAIVCDIGEKCDCPAYYYCPINSARPKACPDTSKCFKKRCTNPTCQKKTNREGNPFLTKILERISKEDDIFDPEFSAGLTIQFYFDVSAATFNGGNGFGIDIELPFAAIPGISLIFLAPPFHCPFELPSYVLSGIGLSTLVSTSVPLRNFGDIRDAAALAKASLSEGLRSLKGRFDPGARVFSGTFGVGLGYTYDTSFNEVEGRHDWSETCFYQSRRTQGNSPSLESPASLRRRTQDNSLSVVELPKQSRALQSTPSTEQVTNVISVLSAALGSGDLPFCFGPSCDDTPRDSSKVIQGVLTSKYTQTCDGVRLSALVSEPITVNKVLYLTLNQVSEEFADGTVDFLSTLMLGDFGIENAELVLDVDAALPSIELSLSGDPALPALGGNTDVATTFFYNLFTGLKFGIKSRISPGGASLELSASTGPAEISDGFSIKDVDGNGFTVFFNYEILPLTGGLSRTQIVKLGLRLPMRICARDCDGKDPEKRPEIFYLKGEVSVSQVVGSTTPPATLLGGQFELDGEWNNPFGLPILNVDNVVAGAEFDLSKAVGTGVPPPSSLLLGATFCLGSSDACTDQVPADKNYIFGSAYVGINTVIPQKNFLFGLFSNFTIEEILNVANVLANEVGGANLDSLINGLPDYVRESGITPLNANNPACGPVNTTALAAGEEELILDCFAWVAISPFGDNEIESINLNIPKGIGFSGRLNLFDQFEVEAEAQIDVIDTATPSFFLNASLEASLHLVGEPFLFIGKNLTADNSGVDGASRFVIDYATFPNVRLLVDIQAAIAIPILRSYGEVTIQVNDDGALLKGKIKFLEVLNPTVEIKWDWAFKNFYAELGNIIFYPGILEMKDLVLDAETQPSLDLSFDIGITVLSFVDLDATLSMEENGDDLFVDFTLVANAELVETTVKGDAKLDLVKIENTKFGSFDVSVAWGGAAKEIGEFVDAAVEKIKDGITSTVNAVGDAIKVIGETIKGFIGSIPFIANTMSNFEDGIERLFNDGDPSVLAQAAISFADDFDKTFEEENWEELGNQVAEQAANLGLNFAESIRLTTNSAASKIVELSEKDQWGCNYKRVDTTTRRCWGVTIEKCVYVFGKRICVDDFSKKCADPKTKNGPKFQDPVCVSKKKKLLEDTRAMLEMAGTIGTGSKITTDGNAAILNKARGPIPNATFDDVTGSVPYSKDCSSVSLQSKISGYTKILDNNADGGISDSDESFETNMVDLDFTPSCGNATGSSTSQAYLDSVRAGINALKQQVNQTVNKDMTGINPSIKAYQPEVQLINLTIGFSNNPNDKELEITCSMLKETNKQKPQITSYDPDCKTTLTYETIKETFDVPTKYPCGTMELTRRWTVSDTCGQSAYVDQFIYQQPRAPIWTDNPWSTPVYTFSTSAETFSPAASNSWPTAESECGFPVTYQSENSDIPEEVVGKCGLWLMKRTWVASLDINYSPLKETCAANGNPEPPTSTIDQFFYVKDDEAPRIIEDVIKPTRVPFFDNYNSTRLNALLIKDIATNEQAKLLGLTAGDVTLTSKDSDVMFSPTNLDNQSTCRADGIAHFVRTWTASDKCGNKDTFTQKIILEHPPEVKTSTTSLEDGTYSYSPGVVQSTNTCIPGKQVSNGPKTFEADFDFSITSNVCSEGEAWNENGCRLLTPLDNPVKVLSVAPEYTSFPSNVTVLTNQSISADEDGTGRPTGEAFCNTPFEIVHEDDAAVLISCGVWEIKRHWTIRPVYLECDVVTDPRLVTEKIQIITVKDIFPPEFITLPDADVDVPFLVDYGPGNSKVSFPIVQEQIESETLRAHAQEFNTDDNFLFISYPIQLTYNDTVSFTNLDDCGQDALAVVERTWATSDNCNQTSTWLQTIYIERSTSATVGDAAAYQVITTGSSRISNTDIAEEFVTSGKDGTSMDNVLLSSEDGTNPTRFSAKGSKRGVLPNNPSKCTGNDKDHNLVFEVCPERQNVKDVILAKKSMGYGPEITGKASKASPMCELDKLEFADENASIDYFQEGEQPLRFGDASDDIERFSDRLTYDRQELITGPKLITCLSQDQGSCLETESSFSNQDGEVIMDVAGKTISLVGSGMVYNFFDISLKDWFYLLPRPRYNDKNYTAPNPKVLVQSPGFVFVNAKYKSTIKLAMKNKGRTTGKSRKLQPSVYHDFETLKSGPFGRIKSSFDFPKQFGDVESKSRKVPGSQWVPRRVEFDADALGQEYFLVNIPNPQIINMDNVTEAKEVAALDMSFTDSEAIAGQMIWTGTFIVGNKFTSLRLKNSIWLGGQIILAGGRLELIDSSVLCGKYAANRPCLANDEVELDDTELP